MAPVTYGELITKAARHCAVGWARLPRHPLANTAEAHQALIAFTDLVQALARLAQLLSSTETSGFRPVFDPSADPLTAASTRLSAALNAAIITKYRRTGPARPITDGDLVAHLRAAIVDVRTATDLLDTHREPDGTWRTPEAPILYNLRNRLSAMNDVAQMAIRLADERPTLLRAVHTAHVPLVWLNTHPPPDLAAVRDSAREVHALSTGHRRSPWITNAVAAGTTVRTTNPLDEIRDRLAQMRITAWRAGRDQSTEAGIPALNLFATTAVIVHGHAALATIYQGDRPADDQGKSDLAPFLIGRAQQWRGIRTQLLLLDSPFTPDPCLADNATAVRKLLVGLNLTRPGEPRASRSLPKPEESTVTGWRTREVHPAVGTTLTHAAEVFEDIAEWNALTLNSLLHTNAVLVPNWVLRGRQSYHLNGTDISDHPDVHTGDLQRALIPAPYEKVREILDSYSSLSSGLLLHYPCSPGPARSAATAFEPPGL